MLQHIPLSLPITLCFIRSHIPLSPFYHPSDSSPRLAPLVLFKEYVTAATPDTTWPIAHRKVRKQQTETLVFLLSILCSMY